MGFADVVERADEAALEQREVRLNCVRMVLGAKGDIFAGRVIDRSVLGEGFADRRIDRAFVGHERRRCVDVLD